MMSASLQAALVTWDGEVGGNWSQPTNWVGNAVPSAGDSLVFTGTVNTTTINDIADGFAVGGIVFTNTGDGESFTLQGANGITLGGDIETAAMSTGSVTDTINLNVQLNGNRTILTGDDHDLKISGIIGQDGSARTLTKLGLGILNLSGANTFNGLTIGNAQYDYDWNIVRIGVDPVGSVGNITSSALGTGTVTVAGGRIMSADMTPRTILNDLIVNGGTGGGAMRLGDAANNGKLTFEGGINLTANRTITTTSDADFNGALTGGTTSRVTKNGGGTLTLGAANSNSGFYVSAGTLAIKHNDALGGTDNQLRAGGATLLMHDGITVSAPLRIDNNGNTKHLRLEGGASNTAEYAGTITLAETGGGNFRVYPQATGGDWNFNQVLTVSGQITGNSFTGGTDAIEIRTDGVLALTNPDNDFTGDIELFTGGCTLRVGDGAALSDATVKLIAGSTKVRLANGVTVTNALLIDDNGGRKQIRLEGTTGNAAAWNGPVTVQESGDANFELVLNGNTNNGGAAGGVTNDPTQVLTIGGPITSTNGAGVAILGDGIAVLSNPSNDITHLIRVNHRVNNNGSTLRIMDSGAVGSSDTNTIILQRANSWLELADGVTLGTQSTFQVNDTGNNHGLRVYNALDGVAESATVACNIMIDEPNPDQSRFVVPDAMDTLIMTGVIANLSTNKAGTMNTRGDGTVVFNGSAPNTFSGNIRIGDGGVSSWNGTTGNKHGFVVVNRDDALGTGSLDGRGAQLQAGVAGLTITNDIIFGNGQLRLGGTNDFELSGDVTVTGTDVIAHYGLEGHTVTLSGDIDISSSNGTLRIEGGNNYDHGTLVFNGTITGTNGGNFEVDYRYDDCDVYLNGTNTYTGKTRVEDGILHVYQEANLGGNPAVFDPDALDLSPNQGSTLHVTETFSIDDPNRGITVGGTQGDDVFDVDATKTLTISPANVIAYSGAGAFDLVKAGDGTLVLQAANTYTLDTRIDGGMLVVTNGAAIVDTTAVVLADATGAVFRLDSSETIGSFSGGGAAGGNVELQANSLTTSNATDTAFAGVISGSGSVTKNGDGALSLSGANTLTGATLINAGRLNLSGSIGGALTMTDGTTLAGEGSAAGKVTLGSATGIDLAVDGSTETAAFSALGGLDVSGGTHTVILEAAPVTGGTFTVINYAGTLTGDETNFQLQDAANYRSAVFADTGSAITLNVGNQAHAWDNGQGNGLWDINASTNWTSADSKFFNGDSVTFGDTGAGVVTLQTNVTAGLVLFTNTTGNAYVVSNAVAETLAAPSGLSVIGSGDVTIEGVIAGTTPITHAGSSVLTLAASNTFTGGITVKPGATLKAGGVIHPAESKAFGAISQSTAVTVEPGGTLDVNGNRRFKTYGAGSIVVSGSGVGGNGAIVNTGPSGNNAFSTQLTLAGDTTVGGTARFDIDNTIRTSVPGITFTKVGPSQVVLAGNNDSASISNFVVNSGILQFENNDAGGNAHVTVNAGGILRAWVGADGTRPVENTVTLNGGRIDGIGTRTTARYQGAIAVVADSRIDPNNNVRIIELAGTITGTNRIDIGNGTTRLTGDISGFTGALHLNEANAILAMGGTDNAANTFSAIAGTFVENGGATAGTLTLGGDNADMAPPCVFRDGVGGGALGLTKAGSGTLTLTETNTYTGVTTINGGTLLVNTISTNASGAVIVAAGATFGGTGRVVGPVMVDGTVAPGASIESLRTGAVSFRDGSAYAFEMDSSAAVEIGADLLTAYGDLSLDGTVNLVLTDIAASPVPQEITITLINYTGNWNGGTFTLGSTVLNDGDEFKTGGKAWMIDYDATAGGANYAADQTGGQFVNITAVPWGTTLIVR